MIAVPIHCTTIPGDAMAQRRLLGQRGAKSPGVMRAAPACAFVALWGLTLVTPGWSMGPNVVLITIDTVRADRVGCYGYRHASTPNLDALAREGVLFQTVVASVPLTLPSHCSILTGTYPPL